MFTTGTQYFVFWSVMYVIIGMVWVNFDRSTGARLYRWMYNLSHKDPLPADVDKGFIHNRPSKRKASAAFVLSLAVSLFAIFFSKVSPLVQLLVFPTGILALMIGFFLGPWASRLWKRQEKVLEQVDKLESGETDLGDQFKGWVHRAGEVVGEMVTGSDEEGKPVLVIEPDAPASIELSKPEVKPEPEVDPREAIKKFVDGR